MTTFGPNGNPSGNPNGRSGAETWEVFEAIGAYTAGELEGPEALEVERLIAEDAEHRRVAEGYARMIAVLAAIGEEPVAAPDAVVSYAIRRAYVASFLRQAEVLLGGIGRTYLDAFVYYFRLRPAAETG